MRHQLRSLVFSLLLAQTRPSLAGPCHLSSALSSTAGATPITTFSSEFPSETPSKSIPLETPTSTPISSPTYTLQSVDSNGVILEAWVSTNNFGGAYVVNSDTSFGPVPGNIAIDPTTNRLFVTFSDGTVLWAATPLPSSTYYWFNFLPADSIGPDKTENYYILASIGLDGYLDLSSSHADEPLYMTYNQAIKAYYGTLDSTLSADYVRFSLSTAS